MNRRFAWAWGLATVVIAAIVGVIAYAAGQANHVVAVTGGGDGRVYYPGYWGFGFFPFFGLFWILLIGFLLFRLVFWRSWGGGWGRYGGGYWHQHPHEHSDTPTSTPPTVPPSGQQSA